MRALLERSVLRGTRELCIGLLVLSPGVAFAHERFVKHDLLHPVQREFFSRLDPNMLDIALRVYAVMAVMLLIWFMRDPLQQFMKTTILGRLRGRRKQWAHLVACFLTDKPVEHPWFKKIGEWAVILFLRCPALVLMHSAATNSLLMPSYPLEPTTAALFKYAQVILAIGIITQTFLPFIGATIFAMVPYLVYAYGWKTAVDMLPLLTAAVVYISAPWNSHRQTTMTVTERQMRWVRITLGFSFFALGWMKVYNHDLTIGVADNFPSVMEDPFIKIFYVGTDPLYKRESWAVAFAGAEVLTGLLIMMGAFSRLWAVQMIFVFGKLMIVDFGWEEIPHLYPIGAFVLMLFSNNLSDEFYRKAESEAYAVHRMKAGWRMEIFPVAAAAVLAFCAVFPMLFFLTLVTHP